MTKQLLSVIFFVFFAACRTFAGSPIDLSKALYPANSEDQEFTSKFFQIVELHKGQDPFFGGRGPSISGYSLDEIKFAFMVNITETQVDLIIFNWSLPVFEGLEIVPDISEMYGKTVYVLKGLDKTLIASQGVNHDTLTNFSYMLGSEYLRAQIQSKNPEFEVPDEILDWKPHPGYMGREHPLRQALGTHSLPLLSPSKELFVSQFATNFTEEMLDIFEKHLEDRGGFEKIILGMMIHEIYHVKEGQDGANGLAEQRDIPLDRENLVEKLESDERLKQLYSAYAKIVFSIGDSLKSETVGQNELQQLRDLSVVISALRTNYPNAWAFIWDFEYTEGFAEYVSAYSTIQIGMTTLAEEIDLQKGDHANNFTYRTGALGGLYLRERLEVMPFDNREEFSRSPWELIIERSDLNGTRLLSESEIVAQYAGYPFDIDAEITSVCEYLVSTVMDQ